MAELGESANEADEAQAREAPSRAGRGEVKVYG